MVKIKKYRMTDESAFLAFSAKILNRAHFLSVPADHLQLVETRFAVTVDPGLGLVHLSQLLWFFTPDADTSHMPFA